MLLYRGQKAVMEVKENTNETIINRVPKTPLISPIKNNNNNNTETINLVNLSKSLMFFLNFIIAFTNNFTS